MLSESVKAAWASRQEISLCHWPAALLWAHNCSALGLEFPVLKCRAQGEQMPLECSRAAWHCGPGAMQTKPPSLLGLYSAPPPSVIPQKSKRSRNSRGTEERWCGDLTSERTEKQRVSLKWHSERLPQGGREPVIFLKGLSLHKSSSGGTFNILTVPLCFVVWFVANTASRQRTVNSGLSILAVLPK